MRLGHQVRTTLLIITFVSRWCLAADGPAETEIGVLTLHGIGSHHQGTHFDARLREALNEKAGEQIRLAVKTVYYHGDSRGRQAELWKEFDRLEDRLPGSLDHKFIRRLMLASVGDALAYGHNASDKNSFYRGAHTKVREAIAELERELGDSCTVAVVANSLGCKVIFDYLCDAQTGRGIWEGEEGPTEFRRLGDLRLLITTGCNLPFFASAVSGTEQRFFRVNKDFQWINFYDRDDVLGWPLRPLGGRFEEIVQDEERNGIGSLLTSHGKYWKHDDLNEEIAGKILDLAGPRAATGENE
jgi:hypothetical protein